jgi:hypothetical protein
MRAHAQTLQLRCGVVVRQSCIGAITRQKRCRDVGTSPKHQGSCARGVIILAQVPASGNIRRVCACVTELIACRGARRSTAPRRTTAAIPAPSARSQPRCVRALSSHGAMDPCGPARRPHDATCVTSSAPPHHLRAWQLAARWHLMPRRRCALSAARVRALHAPMTSCVIAIDASKRMQDSAAGTPTPRSVAAINSAVCAHSNATTPHLFPCTRVASMAVGAPPRHHQRPALHEKSPTHHHGSARALACLPSGDTGMPMRRGARHRCSFRRHTRAGVSIHSSYTQAFVTACTACV